MLGLVFILAVLAILAVWTVQQAIRAAVGVRPPPTSALPPETVAPLLAAPHQLAVRLALFGLGAVLFAAAVAWTDVHRVVQPLRTLTQAAERFASGNLYSNSTIPKWCLARMRDGRRSGMLSMEC